MSVLGYRTHPVHHFERLQIDEGHTALARALARLLHQSPATRSLAIEGFIGVDWERLRRGLQPALDRAGCRGRWISTQRCLGSAAVLYDRLRPFLTDDPVFGRLYRGSLEELWEPAEVSKLREELGQGASPVVIYGFGASRLAIEGSVHVYVDVPKDLGQERAARGEITSVGADRPQPFQEMYKRMYFVEWPMLNRIKRRVWSHLSVFVDGSDLERPRFVDADALRQALSELARQPFRVRPWFAPGPWGGQWMKERFGLPVEQPNYAWSFELIAPENGLLIGDGERSLECSFDCLLWQETERVLGVQVAARYGSYFPIRFDYLDTMGGGNLSCQVHPRLDYARDEFGELLTQDESYYIVDRKKGAEVFLGLKESTVVERFQRAAERARDQGSPMQISEFIHSQPSRQHQLYLIPSGTVHCSGSNNLVLEISATPYIYTFKIYDYLRADLQGRLRPLHLEHAFANLDPHRRSSWVERHLCPVPVTIREGPGWAEYQLSHSDLLFFAIHRLEFVTRIADDTRGRFLALNMVAGDRCEVVTERGDWELRYAESMILPATVGTYEIRNLGMRACKIVKAFVKV
jgi:mannose-6-phosphate isomerase class I